jgi:Na+/phosphate symporter
MSPEEQAPSTGGERMAGEQPASGQPLASAAAPSHRPITFRTGKVILLLIVSLYLFILGLELIKSGARPLGGWLQVLGVTGVKEALGLGWLLACFILSGSPVAAFALGLLDSGKLDALQTFAMINGSRLGASFVVLVVGFVYDLRARRDTGGVYVGALALITTAVVYVPAFALGCLVLKTGWLDGVRFGLPAQIDSFLDMILKPAARAIAGRTPAWGQALLGIGGIIGAFKIFDGFLPVVDPTGGKLSRMATTIYRPWITFAFGMLVTSITLSVSVSLTLLVPLTARGLVRRENLIPYILGANITTFVDTLFASLLLKNSAGFTVVFCEICAVSALSLPLVFLAYRPFERLVDELASQATKSRLRLAAFVVGLFLIPVVLIWI